MKNIVIVSTIMLSLIAILGACASTGNPLEDVVITRIDNVRPEVIKEAIDNPLDENVPAVIIDTAEIDNALPSPFLRSIVEKFMPDASTIVVTERQYLKEEYRASQDLTQVINLTIPTVVDQDTGKASVDVDATVNTIGGVVSTVYPPLAPFVPLLGLLPWLARKRSRQHLKDAVKKAVPADGTIDIVGMINSTMKAFGLEHSSTDPDELERVAKKLRVEAAAKNGGLESMHATIK